jgi:nucleotide-binding universal stress UspA family protein
MPIRTILLNLDVDEANDALVRCAVDLAGQLGAKLVGHCAADAMPVFVGAEGTSIAATVYAELREEIKSRQRRAQELFKRAVPPELAAGWLAPLDAATGCLIDHAAGADLLMLCRPMAAPAPFRRRADLGDVIVGSGRPVIAVSPGIIDIDLDSIVIGWKNTREGRRALADAIPLLAHAKRVVLASVDEGNGQPEIAEAMAFLNGHGITANEVVRTQVDVATALLEICEASSSQLLVTGAYGHNRWRERLFGGVTEALLQEATVVRFFSA